MREVAAGDGGPAEPLAVGVGGAAEHATRKDREDCPSEWTDRPLRSSLPVAPDRDGNTLDAPGNAANRAVVGAVALPRRGISNVQSCVKRACHRCVGGSPRAGPGNRARASTLTAGSQHFGLNSQYVARVDRLEETQVVDGHADYRRRTEIRPCTISRVVTPTHPPLAMIWPYLAARAVRVGVDDLRVESRA